MSENNVRIADLFDKIYCHHSAMRFLVLSIKKIFPKKNTKKIMSILLLRIFILLIGLKIKNPLFMKKHFSRKIT